ncbi:uncharacterized protein LOC133806871 [Humulus lupulus]|uniref:uncharacterized protein LOC133806871 n=1 Tax=Humulus lupulus TaxID=3486 RepID=UPI002B40FE54|nr:uncharacterized protein LOC133806871 [Humulus lupulus]
MREFNMDATTTRQHWSLELNEMDEFHNEAYENAKIYKECTKAWHDKKFIRKEFQPRKQVLLFNSWLKLFSRKLKSRWSGPYTIVRVFSYGSVELQSKYNETFKVNNQRVMPYLGGLIDQAKSIIMLKSV